MGFITSKYNIYLREMKVKKAVSGGGSPVKILFSAWMIDLLSITGSLPSPCVTTTRLHHPMIKIIVSLCRTRGQERRRRRPICSAAAPPPTQWRVCMTSRSVIKMSPHLPHVCMTPMKFSSSAGVRTSAIKFCKKRLSRCIIL